MDEYDGAFGKHFGVGVIRGFNGKPQFIGKGGKKLTTESHNRLTLAYRKYIHEASKQKTIDGVTEILKGLDPTGVSNYPDVYRSVKNNKPFAEIALNAVSSFPLFGKVSTPIKLGKEATVAEKVITNATRVEKVMNKMDKFIPNIGEGFVKNTTGKMLSKVVPTSGFTNVGKTSMAQKVNGVAATINATNKASDIVQTGQAGTYFYDSYKMSQDLQKQKEKPTKPVAKFAMGGRLPSRNRHIAPAVIAQLGIAGVQTALQMFGQGKQQSMQRKQMSLDESNKLKAQMLEQKVGDTNVYNQTDLDGDYVNYYANGGALIGNPVMSQGGFSTKGGDLVPIGDGVEEVVGNRHNETKIDGVSGVVLSANGEQVAEVENKEILVDGNKVISDRLKYDANNSYADKMRTLTKKRNALESQQDKAKGFRAKNTIERKLASLNMAEETLFNQQEMHKMVEGKDTLEKLDTFAFGGTIGGDEGDINEAKLRASGKYKQLDNGFYQQIDNPQIVINRYGQPQYPYDKGNTSPTNPNTVASAVPGVGTVYNGYNASMTPKPKTMQTGVPFVNAQNNTTPTDNISTTPTADNLEGRTTVPGLGAAYSAYLAGNKTPPSEAAEAPLSTADKILGGSTGQAIMTALPGVVSGIGAISMANKTPQLATPLLNRAVETDTRVNVNPQLAAIRGSMKATVDNVLGNSSSSSTARNNITNANLRGAAETNAILTNKQNTETQLRNADAQNKQNVTSANNATLNNHSMMQYQRLNDIRTMKNAGYAHIQGAVQNGLTAKTMRDNFDSYTRANMSIDRLGEKASTMITDKEFMKVPANRAAVMTQVNAMRDGKYLFPFLREQAKELGYLK